MRLSARVRGVRCRHEVKQNRLLDDRRTLSSPTLRILTVGNMYPPHHYGGYELVWQAAVAHLSDRGDDVRVLTTDTRTGASERDDGDVHRQLRWPLHDARFEPLGTRAKVALARH